MVGDIIRVAQIGENPTKLVPCESFECEVYNLTLDKTEKRVVIGYWVRLDASKVDGLWESIEVKPNVSAGNVSRFMRITPVFEPEWHPLLNQ